MAFKQGFYKPINPKKYKGDSSKIVYRSGWELKLMRRLDTNENVLWWGSEEIAIPYISPVDNKYHRYFVDFIVCIQKPNGIKEIKLIEVKPMKQTQQPKRTEIKSRKQQKRLINETLTFAVNKAKWAAAEEYCNKKGFVFEIFTEKQLGI